MANWKGFEVPLDLFFILFLWIHLNAYAYYYYHFFFYNPHQKNPSFHRKISGGQIQ